jgi:hypothetical protein
MRDGSTVNGRRKRGSFRLQKTTNGILKFLIAFTFSYNDVRDDDFEIQQAIGLVLAGKAATSRGTQSYVDTTTSLFLNDCSWIKRGYEGIRVAIRVDRIEIDRLLNDLQLCEHNETPRVFKSVPSNEGDSKRALFLTDIKGFMYYCCISEIGRN